MKDKTVKLHQKTYDGLVAFAAYLTLDLKRKVSLNEAVEWLLKKEAKP